MHGRDIWSPVGKKLLKLKLVNQSFPSCLVISWNVCGMSFEDVENMLEHFEADRSFDVICIQEFTNKKVSRKE
eukprot:12349457-Karenia_brevis.AAC.1